MIAHVFKIKLKTLKTAWSSMKIGPHKFPAVHAVHSLYTSINITLLIHTRNGTVQMRESGVVRINETISSNTARNTQQGSWLLYVWYLVILPYLLISQ